MSGIMSFTGERPDGPPVKCGAPLSDITAGILAAMGILAAYAHRLKTGEGQWVETSLFEAALVQTYWQSAIALATGVAPRAMGSAHPLNAPYQAFATRDGWITVGAANQTNWLRLLDVLDAPALRADERFATASGRMGHLHELEGALNVEFRKRTSAEWLDALERAGIPAGPVFDVKQMHANEQTRARAMVVETKHATLGSVATIGLPMKFSSTPGGIVHGAPVYGQHTREVLREHGFADAEIDAMARAGAVHMSELRVAAE